MDYFTSLSLLTFIQAHFDCLPSEFKVIDGARLRWRSLLLLDSVIYFLNATDFQFVTRRAFNQQKVLYEAVIIELLGLDLDEETALDVRVNSLSVCDSYAVNIESLDVAVEQLHFPWNSVDNLKYNLLQDPPAKSKFKFVSCIDMLCAHKSIAGYDLNDVFRRAIIKVISTGVIYNLQMAAIPVTRRMLTVKKERTMSNVSTDCASEYSSSSCTDSSRSSSRCSSIGESSEDDLFPHLVDSDVGMDEDSELVGYELLAQRQVQLNYEQQVHAYQMAMQQRKQQSRQKKLNKNLNKKFQFHNGFTIVAPSALSKSLVNSHCGSDYAETEQPSKRRTSFDETTDRKVEYVTSNIDDMSLQMGTVTPHGRVPSPVALAWQAALKMCDSAAAPPTTLSPVQSHMCHYMNSSSNSGSGSTKVSPRKVKFSMERISPDLFDEVDKREGLYFSPVDNEQSPVRSYPLITPMALKSMSSLTNTALFITTTGNGATSVSNGHYSEEVEHMVRSCDSLDFLDELCELFCFEEEQDVVHIGGMFVV